MTAKRTGEPSPESVARANRQRLAREEGAQALADAERRAIEIRLNMQRLRGLRESRLAEDASAQTNPRPANKRRNKGNAG
jgi:hypothetical protein